MNASVKGDDVHFVTSHPPQAVVLASSYEAEKRNVLLFILYITNDSESF